LGVLAKAGARSRDWEENRDLKRAGRGVHLPIGKGELARLRIDVAVGKDQLDLPLRLSCCGRVD